MNDVPGAAIDVPRPEGLAHHALVDIGVNLTDDAFDADRDAVLARAHGAGIAHQLLTGTDVEHSRRAAGLAEAAPSTLSATAGVHPHQAGAVAGDWEAALRALHAQPGVRAVGETGLDFFRDFSPRDAQERVFEAQLQLAADSGLPLFLHERGSDGRLFEILAPWRGRVHGVLHCFTGTSADLDAALDLGLHVGVTGWICDERRGDGLRALAPRIPAERLLLETDAPWLLPRTLRPKPRRRRNEPAFLPWVLATLAACRGEDPAQLAERTTANATRLFGLPVPSTG